MKDHFIIILVRNEFDMALARELAKGPKERMPRKLWQCLSESGKHDTSPMAL